MTDSPHLPSRRSIRLAGFDYASNGAYVITICTHQRRHLFGTIQDGHMRNSLIGDLVVQQWEHTAVIRPDAELDAFVLMPNHLHGILILNREEAGRRRWTGQFAAPSGSVGAIVRGLKSAVTSSVRKAFPETACPIWQRGYYDRVVRSEQEMDRFREYVVNNPLQWELDQYFER